MIRFPSIKYQPSLTRIFSKELSRNERKREHSIGLKQRTVTERPAPSVPETKAEKEVR